MRAEQYDASSVLYDNAKHLIEACFKVEVSRNGKQTP
jgi:hypothetical protein